MGRAPCCDKNNVKKGPWSPEEDAKLKEFIEKFGTGGNWIALPQKAGLKRCGKSCRLRWLNYLRPNIKHGEFSDHEDRIICSMYASIGSRWSIIASQLPGRTDNDIKNYWNTKLKKKLLGAAVTSERRPHQQQIFLPHSSSSSTPLASFYTTGSVLLDPFIPTTIPQDMSCIHMPPANAFTLFQGAPQQYQLKEDTSNMIMFGSDQQSCSSSDGNYNQFGNGKELSFEGYLYGGIEQDQNLFQEERCNGLVLSDQSTPLEYNYEEIKQLLMNSNTDYTATAEGSLFHEEGKEGLNSQGKVMMYQL